MEGEGSGVGEDSRYGPLRWCSYYYGASPGTDHTYYGYTSYGVARRLRAEEREDVEEGAEARQAQLGDLALIWLVPSDLRLEKAQRRQAPRTPRQPPDELGHASEQPGKRRGEPAPYERPLGQCTRSLGGKIRHQADARRDAPLVGAQPPHGLQRHPCADRVTYDHKVRLAARRQLALEEASDVVDLLLQVEGLSGRQQRVEGVASEADDRRRGVERLGECRRRRTVERRDAYHSGRGWDWGEARVWLQPRCTSGGMRVRAAATWVSRDENEAQRPATDTHHLGGVAVDGLDVRCQ